MKKISRLTAAPVWMEINIAAYVCFLMFNFGYSNPTTDKTSRTTVSKDLFSNHARQYAAFRPVYPKELYDFIYRHVPVFENAWDAGTGNGQVARELAKTFKNVFATDISDKQIENAVKADNIFYSVAGEQTTFHAEKFDLVCVAQAIHWFDRERFYNEVKRVAKPNALLSVWGYGLLKINEYIDPLIRDFYVNVIGKYWDADRRLIDEEYKIIAFPFEEIKAPPFSIEVSWSMDELHGYLTTWSSVQKFIQQHQYNPVEELIQRIQVQWQGEKMQVRFPIFMRVGK